VRNVRKAKQKQNNKQSYVALDERTLKMIPSLSKETQSTEYLEMLDKLSIQAYEENKAAWKRRNMMIRSAPIFALTACMIVFAVWFVVLMVVGRPVIYNIVFAGASSVFIGSIICLVIVSISIYKRDDIEQILLDSDRVDNMPVAPHTTGTVPKNRAQAPSRVVAKITAKAMIISASITAFGAIIVAVIAALT